MGKPIWQTNFPEILEYRTSILTSFNGIINLVITEQKEILMNEMNFCIKYCNKTIGLLKVYIIRGAESALNKLTGFTC